MQNLSPHDSWKVSPIANNIVTAIQAELPQKIFAGTPSILPLNSKRIIMALDYQGPGLGKLKGKKGKSNRTGHWIQGHIVISRDGGQTWEPKMVFPSGNARLFAIKSNIYLVSYTNGLQLAYSGDGGENWSKPESITPHTAEFSNFDGGPPAVLITDNQVYILAFARPDDKTRGNITDQLTPVLLQANITGSILNRKHWQINRLSDTFDKFIDANQFSAIGAPIFNIPPHEREHALGNGCWAARPGWSHPHLLCIADTAHPWQNSEKTILHLIARAAAHRSNIATLGRLDPETAKLTQQRTPANTNFSLLPLPGGHLPFALIQDPQTKIFWLISNNANNSLIPPRRLPHTHSGLPAEQRDSLQLYFSYNLIDWSFGALLATASENGFISIHTPNAAIHGDTLFICARAADSNAKNQHDANNIISFSVPHFRDLIY